MTPRLKKLLVGFAISVVILIADRVSQSNGADTKSRPKKEEKRARTARIDPNRMKRVKEEAARIKASKNKKETVIQKEFRPIPEDVLALSGWGRNPFTTLKPAALASVNNPQVGHPVPVQEKAIMSSVHSLKIESVATLGEKTFVIINGQRFQEGDKIDNMIIETIENSKIIFKVGNKKIVKNVGA